MTHHRLVVDTLGLCANGRALLKDITFDAHGGELLIITGPNGAGKSTLLETLAGIHLPEQGRSTLTIKKTSSPTSIAKAHTSDIAFIFQDLRLVPQHSAVDNVAAGALHRHHAVVTLFGMPRQERIAARRTLAELGFNPNQCDQNTASLSGGEQQRVAIGRALMQDAPVIFADEPIAHQDTSWSHSIMQRLQSLAHDQGRLVLAVVHDTVLVQQYADRVIQLSNGMVTYNGSVRLWRQQASA